MIELNFETFQIEAIQNNQVLSSQSVEQFHQTILFLISGIQSANYSSIKYFTEL